MDEISYMRGTFSEKSQKYFKEVEQAWKKEEEKLRVVGFQIPTTEEEEYEEEDE